MDRGPDPFGAFVAFASEAHGGDGALAGLRFAVKDNIAVAGMPYTAGLPMFAARTAAADAWPVARIREAGGEIVGVTRTDAGGLGVATPDVVNPAAPETIAGGSSGGSAAAVAGGLADAALGTDTGGSVRIPAACCGLFGFKPSHGRVSAEGVWPLAAEIEDVGVIAADIGVLTRTVRVLLGSEDAVGAPHPIAVGIDLAIMASCDVAIAESFGEWLNRLQRAGCIVREVRLPDRRELSFIHATLALAGAAQVYGDAVRRRDETGLGKLAWRSLQAASELDDAQVASARASRARLQPEWDQAMRAVDCIALPTLPVPVPLRGARRIRWGDEDLPLAAVLTALTAPANLFGAPAIALPLVGGLGSLQLAAAAGGDEALLAAAARIHAMLGVH
jgi:Asp-tRNA(Asn)/Glu-tRNA(Gln) amidotransferase A subunit family amidase